LVRIKGRHPSTQNKKLEKPGGGIKSKKKGGGGSRLKCEEISVIRKGGNKRNGHRRNITGPPP